MSQCRRPSATLARLEDRRRRCLIWHDSGYGSHGLVEEMTKVVEKMEAWAMKMVVLAADVDGGQDLDGVVGEVGVW
ncbi:extensin-like [Iris pallida]|uniref:Extensin-like n=1 Tax=Iris pallida TaxID=29817 RepID=A0AAX6GWX6_IRIPA|nr:extensin-like [Iris pallida]